MTLHKKDNVVNRRQNKTIKGLVKETGAASV